MRHKLTITFEIEFNATRGDEIAMVASNLVKRACHDINNDDYAFTYWTLQSFQINQVPPMQPDISRE